MKNVNDLQNKAKRDDALDNVSERLTRFKGDIQDAAQDAGRSIRSYYDEKRSELSELADEYSATVRRRPIQTTLVAAAFGYLIGRLLTSSK